MIFAQTVRKDRLVGLNVLSDDVQRYGLAVKCISGL